MFVNIFLIVIVSINVILTTLILSRWCTDKFAKELENSLLLINKKQKNFEATPSEDISQNRKEISDTFFELYFIKNVYNTK